MDNLFQRTQSTSASASSSSSQSCSLQWKNLNKFIGEGVVSPSLLQRLTKNDIDLSKLTYKKQILFNINGNVNSGEMVALMGPSGSGKTTLLNVLGGRGLANLSGDVLMGGAKFKKSMKKSIAYVLQDDIFFTNLTVREQLYYTAVLRLPEYKPPIDDGYNKESNNLLSGIKSLCQSISNAMTNSNKIGGSGVHSSNYYDKMKEVNTILKILRMEKCADTPIYLISGGERKRCNIGTELLTSPKILLLDEPTSGLDSTAANALVITLRQLASHGLTIVTSIHQPSSKVFYSFDKLLLLADGHVVYSGKPSKCLAYFATLNYFPPADYNPADFVMDLLTASSTAISSANAGILNDDDTSGDSGGSGAGAAAEVTYSSKMARTIGKNGRSHECSMEEGIPHNSHNSCNNSSNHKDTRKSTATATSATVYLKHVRGEEKDEEESKTSPLIHHSPSHRDNSYSHHQQQQQQQSSLTSGTDEEKVSSSPSSSSSSFISNTPSLGIEPLVSTASPSSLSPTANISVATAAGVENGGEGERENNNYGNNYNNDYHYTSNTDGIYNNNTDSSIISIRDHLIQAWAVKEAKEKEEVERGELRQRRQHQHQQQSCIITDKETGISTATLTNTTTANTTPSPPVTTTVGEGKGGGVSNLMNSTTITTANNNNNNNSTTTTVGSNLQQTMFERNDVSYTSSFYNRPEQNLIEINTNNTSTNINTEEKTSSSAAAAAVVTGTPVGIIGGGGEEEEFKFKYPTSYQTQFFILLERALKNAKSESMTGLHFMETIGITLICGFIWFQLPYTEEQVNNRAGYIFFFQSYWFIMSLFQGMMQFLPERVILLKERSAGSYHLSAYFLSKTISGLPIRLLLPFLFLAISYPMVNLNPSVRVFFAVVGTQLLATLCGESVGVFIGTLSTDFQKCLTMATLASMLLMLTGGFYAQKLPIFMFWLTYISPFKYSYDACVFLVFSTPLPCTNGYTLPTCIYSPTFTASTKDVANYLGATQSVGLNIGLLFIFMLSFRFFAYLSLRYIPHNNGRK